MQYKEYHTLRWSAGLGALVFWLMYVYRDEVKMWFGTTSADITSRTLGDLAVQREAQNLAQGVVYQLLNDAHALRLTTEFLNQLLEREHTRRAVIDLLASVSARQETQEMLHNLFVRILTSPEFVTQASAFFQDVLQRESTVIALRNLFTSLYADPASQRVTAEFFQSVMNTDTFRDTVAQLGADTAHSVMNDPEVSKRAVVWINSVLGEPDLHSKAGDAIWGAITSTFIPGFLGGGGARAAAKAKKDIVDIDETMAALRMDKDRAAAADKPVKPEKPQDEEPARVSGLAEEDPLQPFRSDSQDQRSTAPSPTATAAKPAPPASGGIKIDGDETRTQAAVTVVQPHPDTGGAVVITASEPAVRLSESAGSQTASPGEPSAESPLPKEVVKVAKKPGAIIIDLEGSSASAMARESAP